MTQDEMEAVIAGAPSKAEKIRRLHRAGVEKADIGRFLEITYQHVYNVLARTRRANPAPNALSEKVAPQIFHIQLERGLTFALPKDYVEAEGLKPGSTLICRRDADGIKIMSRTAAEDHLRNILRQRLPDQAELLEAVLTPEKRF